MGYAQRSEPYLVTWWLRYTSNGFIYADTGQVSADHVEDVAPDAAVDEEEEEEDEVLVEEDQVVGLVSVLSFISLTRLIHLFSWDRKSVV